MPNCASSRENPAGHQLLERTRAVADGVLCVRRHFAKGLLHALGDKDRVVPKPEGAAWRENEPAGNLALENQMGPVRAQKWRVHRQILPRHCPSPTCPIRVRPALSPSKNPFQVRPSGPNRFRVLRRAHPPQDRNHRRGLHGAGVSAAETAFSSAFSAKVAPVSSGSTRPSEPAP